MKVFQSYTTDDSGARIVSFTLDNYVDYNNYWVNAKNTLVDLFFEDDALEIQDKINEYVELEDCGFEEAVYEVFADNGIYLGDFEFE